MNVTQRKLTFLTITITFQNVMVLLDNQKTIIIDQNGIIVDHFIGGVSRDLLGLKLQQLTK
ncbi:hypothetical protein KHA80_10310 [Anaerobacillus sp. HL2]|nr:hypothetical protein KHA80_10310 [Anaerobacillus sp. HL2]